MYLGVLKTRQVFSNRFCWEKWYQIIFARLTGDDLINIYGEWYHFLMQSRCSICTFRVITLVITYITFFQTVGFVKMQSFSVFIKSSNFSFLCRKSFFPLGTLHKIRNWLIQKFMKNSAVFTAASQVLDQIQNRNLWRLLLKGS